MFFLVTELFWIYRKIFWHRFDYFYFDVILLEIVIFLFRRIILAAREKQKTLHRAKLACFPYRFAKLGGTF